MVFCIIFNASVLYPFEVFVSNSKTPKFHAASLGQLYMFVGYIHSVILTEKLLSALWPLLS